MKLSIRVVPALALCWYILFTPTQKLHAQSGEGAKRFEQLAKELKLTPQQKAQVIPILEGEAPRVEAIKGDPSLSKVQKLEQLKAVHAQTDPQVKSILTPEQYQKLQEIRHKEVGQAVKKKLD